MKPEAASLAREQHNASEPQVAAPEVAIGQGHAPGVRPCGARGRRQPMRLGMQPSTTLLQTLGKVNLDQCSCGCATQQPLPL
jgi:hypothetical protein